MVLHGPEHTSPSTETPQIPSGNSRRLTREASHIAAPDKPVTVHHRMAGVCRRFGAKLFHTITIILIEVVVIAVVVVVAAVAVVVTAAAAAAVVVVAAAAAADE